MTREEAIEIVKKHGILADGTKFESALRELIPELRESEDERIRKEIIDFIQWAEDRGMTRYDYHQAKRPAVWIAYLEKQKEQKLYEPQLQEEDNIKQKLSVVLNFLELSREHFPKSTGIDTTIEWFKSFITGKEQKSVDYEAELKKCKDNPLYFYDKYVKIKLKPAEWSEEDSDNLEKVDNYLWMLDNYIGDDCAIPQGNTDKIRGNIQGILSPWLKSLPERFNLQPKQEWSEEDETYLQDTLWCIEQAEKVAKDEGDMGACWSARRWLKSLRPSWKPSEDEDSKKSK